MTKNDKHLIKELIRSYFSEFKFIDVQDYSTLKAIGFYLRKDPNDWAQTIYYNLDDQTFSTELGTLYATKIPISDPECLDKLNKILWIHNATS